MTADNPSAPRVDTTWFAVDAEGALAAFYSPEAGAVPCYAADSEEIANLLKQEGHQTQALVSARGIWWSAQRPQEASGYKAVVVVAESVARRRRRSNDHNSSILLTWTSCAGPAPWCSTWRRR
jgi:hypothetical protein